MNLQVWNQIVLKPNVAHHHLQTAASFRHDEDNLMTTCPTVHDQLPVNFLDKHCNKLGLLQNSNR